MKLKYEQIINAMDRLDEAIILLQKNILSNQEEQADYASKEELYKGLRDSLIQRFEITTDLFWKYVKKYLEQVFGQEVKFNGPTPVLRQACKAKLISEVDTAILIKMIKDRNSSSHIYKEEMADDIAKRIPDYYQLLKKNIDLLIPVSPVSDE